MTERIPVTYPHGSDPFVSNSVLMLNMIRDKDDLDDNDVKVVANILKWTLLELEARGVLGNE